MARVLMVIVTVCFVASLSPFLMPGALIGLVGNGLNGALADPVWTLLLPRVARWWPAGRTGPYSRSRAWCVGTLGRMARMCSRILAVRQHGGVSHARGASYRRGFVYSSAMLR